MRGRVVLFVGDSLANYQAFSLLFLVSDRKTTSIESCERVARSKAFGSGENIHQMSWCRAVCAKVHGKMSRKNRCREVHTVVCWLSAGKSESPTMLRRTLALVTTWVFSSLSTLTTHDVIVGSYGHHFFPRYSERRMLARQLEAFVEVCRWHADGRWRMGVDANDEAAATDGGQSWTRRVPHTLYREANPQFWPGGVSQGASARRRGSTIACHHGITRLSSGRTAGGGTSRPDRRKVPSNNSSDREPSPRTMLTAATPSRGARSACCVRGCRARSSDRESHPLQAIAPIPSYPAQRTPSGQSARCARRLAARAAMGSGRYRPRRHGQEPALARPRGAPGSESAGDVAGVAADAGLVRRRALCMWGRNCSARDGSYGAICGKRGRANGTAYRPYPLACCTELSPVQKCGHMTHAAFAGYRRARCTTTTGP